MPLLDPRQGVLTARNIFVGSAGLFVLWMIWLPTSPAQAALLGFLLGSMVWLRLLRRGLLDGLAVRRMHHPRVFEGQAVEVTLRLTRGEGLPIQLLELSDQFMASLSIDERHLVPILPRGWEVLIHYQRTAERHRGLYVLGPLQLRAADPLGVFWDARELPCLTNLTVYPKADPLPHYRIPAELPPPGASMDALAAIGQGEQILGVREYRAGDPPARVHWRTSARRRKLHVIQLDRPIQAELAVLLDFTRRARFGLGGEATTELAIHAATALLTRAAEARHRFSLAYAHREPVYFPAGSGMAQLYLLLDRLAVITPGGESDYWAMAGARALALEPGSRAVFVVTAAQTPAAAAAALIERVLARGVAADVALIDEHAFVRIYGDQEHDVRRGAPPFELVRGALTRAGARVFPIMRHGPGPGAALQPENQFRSHG